MILLGKGHILLAEKYLLFKGQNLIGLDILKSISEIEI